MTSYVRFSETFAYDATGNRTQTTQQTGSATTNTGYVANNLNQYTRIDYSQPATRSSLPTYDPSGNLLTDGTNTNTYTYDAQNRLISGARLGTGP